MSKGLAVIYDPHNFFEFVWYYSTYGEHLEWDAICLPNGNKGTYMAEYCKESGIFDEVYVYDDCFDAMSKGEKLSMFVQMLMYAIVGKQNIYCEKLVNKYVDISEYEIVVVLTDAGVFNGAIMALGDKANVVVLEDGDGDYVERKNSNIFRHFFSPYYWQGFLLAKMGYACPGHSFPLKSTQYCEKFSMLPDKMPYRDYKDIKQLFDFKNTNESLYQSIFEKIYVDLNTIDFKIVDAVLLTENIYDFSQEPEEYAEKIERYINQNYSSILLKRHPRDDYQYNFGDNVTVIEVDQSLPAEVLLPYIKGKEVIIYGTTSVGIYLGKNNTVKYLYLDGFDRASARQNTPAQYATYSQVEDYMELYELEGEITKLM